MNIIKIKCPHCKKRYKTERLDKWGIFIKGSYYCHNCDTVFTIDRCECCNKIRNIHGAGLCKYCYKPGKIKYKSDMPF